MDTVKDVTKELSGMGIGGIATEAEWYCKANNEKDILGISLKNKI